MPFSKYGEAVSSITIGLPATCTISVTLGGNITAKEPAVVRGPIPWQPIASAPNAYPSGTYPWPCISKDGSKLAVAHRGSTSPKYLTTYNWNASLKRFDIASAPSSAPTQEGQCVSMDSTGSRLVVGCYTYENEMFILDQEKYDEWWKQQHPEPIASGT